MWFCSALRSWPLCSWFQHEALWFAITTYRMAVWTPNSFRPDYRVSWFHLWHSVLMCPWSKQLWEWLQWSKAGSQGAELKVKKTAGPTMPNNNNNNTRFGKTNTKHCWLIPMLAKSSRAPLGLHTRNLSRRFKQKHICFHSLLCAAMVWKILLTSS